MTNLELAKQIVSLLGGKENVVKAANCMTPACDLQKYRAC